MHRSALDQSSQRIEKCNSILNGWSSSEYLLFDERQVSLAKETVLSELSRLNSLISTNCRSIDTTVVQILHNLNSDKFDEIKPELGKMNSSLSMILKNRDQTARDTSVQTIYEFLKGYFLKNKNLRLTYKEQVFKNSTEILDLVKIIGGAIEQGSEQNHFKDKLEKAYPIIQETMLLSLDILNDHLSSSGDLKMRISGIGQTERNSIESITTDLLKLIRSVTDFDSLVYGMLLMDLNFLSSLITKSLCFANRQLLECANTASRQSIEAANAFFYIQLAREGTQTIPDIIADFIRAFQGFMKSLLIKNVSNYLIDEEEEDIQSNKGTGTVDPFESIVCLNSKQVNSCIDLAIDKVNMYIEEIANGKHANSITFNVYSKTYSDVMLKLSRKLALLEDYK
jgi:hypothetical protein